MERYQNNIQDLVGDAVSGVTVTVRRVSDGGLASLFSDNSGTSKTNPFTNDADGEFFFYAVNNRYDIFFTGPITDQKDDVLLLDIPTTGNTIRINTDINTATPPLAESVTANYEIWDLANDDKLFSLGYTGFNDIVFNNFMENGLLVFQSTKTGGGGATILHGHPDNSIFLYYNGGIRFKTNNFNCAIVDSLNAGQGGNHGTNLSFIQANGTFIGLVGWDGGSSPFKIRSLSHGANVIIEGENAAGTLRPGLDFDPDAGVSLYHTNAVKLRTVLHTAAGQISGAEIRDGFNAFRPVGLGVSRQRALSGTGTQQYFTQAGVGATIYWTGSSATNIDTFASTGSDQTNIPEGAWWSLQNDGAGVLTLRGGSGVTIRHWAGDGTPVDEDVIIPRGALVFIRKQSDTVYDFSIILQSAGGAAVLKFKPSDETRTSDNSPSDDNDLIGWPLVAGGRYRFKAVFLAHANGTTPDILWDFVFSNAPQYSRYKWLSQDGFTQEDQALPMTTNAVTNLGNADSVIDMEGYFTANASTGGTLKLQWSQNASSANTTTLLEGTWMEVERLL